MKAINPYLHNGVGIAGNDLRLIGPFLPGDRLESLVFMVEGAAGALSVDIVLKSSGETDLSSELSSYGDVTERAGSAGVTVAPPGDFSGNHTGSIEVPVCIRFSEAYRFILVRPNFNCGLFWKWTEGFPDANRS